MAELLTVRHPRGKRLAAERAAAAEAAAKLKAGEATPPGSVPTSFKPVGGSGYTDTSAKDQTQSGSTKSLTAGASPKKDDSPSMSTTTKIAIGVVAVGGLVLILGARKVAAPLTWYEKFLKAGKDALESGKRVVATAKG